MFVGEEECIEGMRRNRGMYGNEGGRFWDNLLKGKGYRVKMVEKGGLYRND